MILILFEILAVRFYLVVLPRLWPVLFISTSGRVDISFEIFSRCFVKRHEWRICFCCSRRLMGAHVELLYIKFVLMSMLRFKSRRIGALLCSWAANLPIRSRYRARPVIASIATALWALFNQKETLVLSLRTLPRTERGGQ